MSESFRSRMLRYLIPVLYPPVGRTGVRVTYISADYREVKIKLPLNWKTRNIVGTIFGGSLYASIDPFYMSMLLKLLGRSYLVWDKAATIRFKKPGRSTLYATFRLTEEDLDSIRRELNSEPRVERTYLVELVDAQGVVHAEIEKTISIKLREQKQPARSDVARDEAPALLPASEGPK